jgi:hypothetical protein
MRTRAKVATAVTAAALAISAGGMAAMAATNGLQPPAAKSLAKAAAVGPIDSSTEAKYTAITPCRLVDTRRAGGVVTNTAPRSFVAASTSSLAAQGGDPAGCGIPAAAVAIQANVVAVGSAGSGFLKVYPAGAPAPAASFLNFRDGKAVANGGAITVDTSGAKHFTVLTSRTSHVVVDVSGYFIKPMWVHVGGTGNLLDGSRVASVTAPQKGTYSVLFDRDVRHCAYSVTVFAGLVFAATQPLNADPDGVFVLLQNSTGLITDAEFYLTVTC